MVSSDSTSTYSLGISYPSIIDSLTNAQIVGSRGGRTREIIDFSLVLRNPTRCIVDRDGFSRRFMDAEIAMLLAGVYDGDLLSAITPQAAELTTPLTAYGPRVRHQIPLIINELRERPESRRAVIYVGRHDDLKSIGDETAGEMPCTLTWQFLIRDDSLHMIVNMRSWDAVWGLSYDVPCFVAVQLAIAKALGVLVGDYRHHAGSFHLYERHWNVKARETNDANLDLDWLCDTWEETRTAATAFVEIYRVGAIREAVDKLASGED
jgi:thymidylate synthase